MSSNASDFRHLQIPEVATFEDGPGGLVRLSVCSPVATARICLHGAHVTQYQPRAMAPVLFMSGASHFAPGKAIRGGVPVIFPWFGGRSGHPESPAHGFARTLPWEVELLSWDGQTIAIVLKLDSNQATRARWPHDFILRHRIRVGAQLEMVLEVENTSSTALQFEEALHTYLAVAEVRNVAITGLAETTFIDKVDGSTHKRQDDPEVRITGETDRVYLHTQTTCVLEDPGLRRRISVAKSGSDSTVIWNPWAAKARVMTDFGDDEWPRMVCIETANAGENAVPLQPRGIHRMTATIAAVPL